MSEQELIEQLADKEHDSWARWMKYLFSKCEWQPDWSVRIPAALVKRWQKQIDTPYAELSEQEKQSDRDEVAHILPIIRNVVGAPLPQLERIAAALEEQNRITAEWIALQKQWHEEGDPSVGEQIVAIHERHRAELLRLAEGQAQQTSTRIGAAYEAYMASLGSQPAEETGE